MDERVRRLELAFESTAATVALLEERIAALENGERPRRLDDAEVGEDGGDAVLGSQINAQLAAVLGTPTLVGRSLLVLAGAFLLRALTERGTLAPGTGVALGMAYAVIWIVVAAFAARSGSRASAGFYAVCAAVIAGPLLYEASTSFGVVSPTAGAGALAGVTAAGLLVSIKWRMQPTAWVFTLACVITAAAVATVRSPGEAATAVVVVLGVATLWYAGDVSWSGLKWITALAADLAVLRLTEIATVTANLRPTVGPVHPTLVASLQAVLVVGFVGTFVVRSLRGSVPVGAFEFVQTVAVWVIGWGGAVRLAEVNGWSTGGLAFVALVAGAAGYAGAFGVVDRKQGRNAAFTYLSSLGLGLVLVGVPGVAGTAAAVVWASLAVGVAAVGSRWDRVTLRVHAAILAAASWISAGVVPGVVSGLAGGEAVRHAPGVETGLVFLLTLAATAVVVAGRRRGTGGWLQRLPLTGLLLLSVSAVAAVVVSALSAFLSPGTDAATGTVALSMVTVALAVMASRWGIREAGWLVTPLLLVTGLRMVARDFTSGKTLALVIALAAYGFALIVATRLLRKGEGVPVRDPSD
jgi:hypothetical protein